MALTQDIIDFLADDYYTLYRCSLVNWGFNHAASQLLYYRVVLSPSFRPVLNLKDTGLIPERSNFSSALNPRNAAHVCILEVSGFVSPRSPPRNMISEKIADGIKLFVNLKTVLFEPTTYHEELFQPSLTALTQITTLDEISVNPSCSDEHRALSLVKLGNLRKLSLISPGRAILELLPDWLSRLSETLVELHLKSNCGSVTPGVLTSLIPHLQHRVRAVTLGLSYSLTNNDVFSFLDQLSNLENLQLHYYWQMKRPNRQPKLLALRSFTATYSQVHTKMEVNELDKWIRRAISGSPRLRKLCLMSDDSHQESMHDDLSPAVAHDAIVDHIVEKHAETIRVLCFRSAFVSVKRLRALLGSCTRLEECQLPVGREALEFVASSQLQLPSLHTLSFRISNVKRSYQIDEKDILELTRRFSALCRLSINESAWKVEWKTNSEHNVERVVERDIYDMPPWAQNR